QPSTQLTWDCPHRCAIGSGTSSPTGLQVVRIGDNTSSTLVQSTGTPQGCVLSPALFTLFTSDCSAIHSTNTIVKFADDTTVVGLISDNDETHYREEIQHLTQWCSNNNLVLNTSKTKEVIVDYRSSPSKEGSTKTLFFLRKLKRAGLSPQLLTNFYRATIESILCLCRIQKKAQHIAADQGKRTVCTASLWKMVVVRDSCDGCFLSQGWFAGRNLAVSQVTTKYFLWVDDDFVFTEETKIEKLVEVMEAVPELDVVRMKRLMFEESEAGTNRAVINLLCLILHVISWAGRYKGTSFTSPFSMRKERKWMAAACTESLKGSSTPLPGYPQCSVASGVVNFFLARTDAALRVGFGPKLQRVAHSEFFMDGLGSLLVASCDHVTIGHQPKTGQDEDAARYAKFRHPPKSDVEFKLQLHFFKNHLKRFALTRLISAGFPPPRGPCTCPDGSVLLKDHLPKEQYEELVQRRAKELQQHKARSVYSKGSLVYSGNGETVLMLESNSLVILNEVLAKVSYSSTVYHIHTGDLASFQFESHEAVFPITIKQPQLPVLYDMGTDISSQVTITTKTFLRYTQIKELLKSIRRFYSNIKVIIADDSFEPEHITEEYVQHYIMPPAQGWFAGRNLAVSQVTTKYFLWVDDDFVFTEETKIEKLVEVMEAVPELDVLGGSVQGNQFYFSLLYEEGEEMDGGCLHRKSKGKFHSLPGYPQCSVVSGVVNFFLARTDAVLRVGFDPKLQRVAHSEFFMDGLGSLLVASCDHVTIGHQPKTGQDKDAARYTKFRHPPKSDVKLKLQLHFFKNHLKCVQYG
ncbi:hypothetical protein L3Q82_014552, partial [Scortum barcoo]